MKVLQIDRDFTRNYISDLDGFLGALLKQSSLIRSYEGTLDTAVHKLKSQTQALSGKLNSSRWSTIKYDLSIDPNFTLEFSNVLLDRVRHQCKFYICVGGKLKIRGGILESQSISLNIVYKGSEDLSPEMAEAWRCPQFGTDYHVIRKFHFDLDKTLEAGKWPLSHLQYGGKDKPEFMPFENIRYELFAPMDTPRLPNPPYSLILCLDLFLRSLATQSSSITSEKFWRECVKRSEDRWMKPFYRDIATFLEDPARSQSLYDYFSDRHESL